MIQNASFKYSRFNRVFSRGGRFFLYNSLSNSFVELDKELYELLSTLKVGASVTNLPSNAMELLTKIRGCVKDDDYEIDKIKYIVLSNRYRRDRLVLTINPTLSCNFACPYCFEYTHSGKTMTPEVEDKIVEFIKSYKTAQSISVTWFGGEPLLAFNRIESLSSKILDLGLKYRAGMITNGYLMTPEISRKLPQLRIGNLQITLDGPEEAHNKRRHLKNGGPTYARIIQSIHTLVENAPEIRIGVRVNIDPENAKDFLTLYDYFKEEFNGRVNIAPAFTGDSTDKGSHCIFDKRERQSFLFGIFNERGLDFSGFYPGTFRSECAVKSQGSFIIGPEGELYGCWNDVGNPYKVYGNIDGLISNETEFIKYKVSADSLYDNECQACLLYPVCNGGCPYERIKRLGKGLPANDCPLIKEELDEYLWKHYQSLTNKKKHCDF